MHHVKGKRCKTKKGKYFMIGCIFVVIAVAVVSLLLIQIGKRDRVVGKDIAVGDITEFYYTYSSSTNPPRYQRYRFYVEDGAYRFYHEKREGNVWPLTESHITLSDSVALSEEEWIEFLNFLEGGSVKKRTRNAESGSSGPWLYLYWKDDRGKYQVFSFATFDAKNNFEAFCEKLVIGNGK